MKGSGVRVPASASQSPCIFAGFGPARWIVIGADEADWAMRHVGGGSLVRFASDRRRAWVRANGRPRSSGSRGEASRIRLLDLGQAARLAPASIGPTGAAPCGARVGSIPRPLAVARRRPASSACAELANGRCAATRGPRLAFTSVRASRGCRRGWLCPGTAAGGGAGPVETVTGSLGKRYRRRRSYFTRPSRRRLRRGGCSFNSSKPRWNDRGFALVRRARIRCYDC